MRRRNIKIYFNEDFLETQPLETENTVVHELLHVLFYKLTDKTSQIIRNYVRRSSARQKLKDSIDNLEHKIIDKLTPAFTIRKCTKNIEGK